MISAILANPATGLLLLLALIAVSVLADISPPTVPAARQRSLVAAVWLLFLLLCAAYAIRYADLIASA